MIITQPIVELNPPIITTGIVQDNYAVYSANNMNNMGQYNTPYNGNLNYQAYNGGVYRQL